MATRAPEELIREQAAVIASQADAIARGTLVGPIGAAVARIKRNIEVLEAWTADA